MKIDQLIIYCLAHTKYDKLQKNLIFVQRPAFGNSASNARLLGSSCSKKKLIQSNINCLDKFLTYNILAIHHRNEKNRDKKKKSFFYLDKNTFVYNFYIDNC